VLFSSQLTQQPERGSHLRAEKLTPFPRGEVRTLIHPELRLAQKPGKLPVMGC
jgi:hypothetical protein